MKFEMPGGTRHGIATIVVYGVGDEADNPQPYKTVRYEDRDCSRQNHGQFRLPIGVEINEQLPQPKPPKPGDIDIQIQLFTQDLAPEGAQLVETLAYSSLVRLAATFDDVLELTGPIHFGTSEFFLDTTFAVPMTTFDPSPVDPTRIAPGVGETIRHLGIAPRSIDTQPIVPAAVQRYFQAERQPDAENAFIDYWLVCVMLAGGQGKTDEKVAIARFLTAQLSGRTTLPFPSVEELVRTLTRPLDEVRNSILHGRQLGPLNNPEEVGIISDLAETMLHLSVGGHGGHLPQRLCDRIWPPLPPTS